jgi:DnaJ-class molecular chaperone
MIITMGIMVVFFFIIFNRYHKNPTVRKVSYQRPFNVCDICEGSGNERIPRSSSLKAKVKCRICKGTGLIN